MSRNVLPSRWLQAPLANGIGRHICQLQRITIKFCKSSPDSRGVRDYIESELVEFSRRNPETVVYVKPRRFRKPLLVAEYVNGNWQWVALRNFSCEEVHKWMEQMRTRAGNDILNLRRRWRTHYPSTQGVWHPMLNRDTAENLASFPDEDLGRSLTEEPDATSVLRYLFDVQQRRMANDENSAAN